MTFRLPVEYHGVVVQHDPGRKLLSLKAAFMEPSFEPVASSDPPRASLANWWRAVAKRIRDSYDKKMIPEDLKTAMKGRSKLYLSAVGDAMDIVDLAAEAPAVEHVAEASDVGLRRRSVRAGLFPGPASLPRVRLPPASANPTLVAVGLCYLGPGLVRMAVAVPVRRRAERIPRRVRSVHSAGLQQRSWGS